MIGALIWKEYREHQAVWVAMAGFGVLLLGGLAQLLSPGDLRSPWSSELLVVVVAALSMAGTYGLVCGSMMLAGEREAGTLAFLDTQPVHRLRLWAMKLFVAMWLTLGQVLLLAALVRAFGLVTEEFPLGSWFWMLLAVALEGLAWGLLASALCRSVLPAAGLTTIFLGGSWIVGGVVTWPPTGLLLAVRLSLAMLALAGSAWVFGGADLLRLLARRSAQGRDVALVPWLESWRRVWWLSVRQGRWLAVLLCLGGLLLGLTLPVYGLVLWPSLTLGVGIICGVASFAPDQTARAYRFLGDQRLPLGRFWMMKTLIWLVLASGVALLALFAGTITLHVIEFERGWRGGNPQEGLLLRLLGQSRLVDFVGQGVFVSLWLAVGFGVGQLFGLICRKSAVALVLAVLVAPLAVLLWLPSVAWGGVRLWQVLTLPVLLLLASRLVIWAWASERLRQGRPIATLLGCVLLIGAWTGANLSYRILEVPDAGEPFDVPAYVASLPTAEKNQAGRLINLAARELAEHEKSVPGSYYDRIVLEVLERGWQEEDRELGHWLDRICEGEWLRHLRTSAALPLGMVEDPQSFTPTTLFPNYNDICKFASLLTARALQVQARGDPAAALDHLVVALALSRNLRNHAPLVYCQVGRTDEATALTGLDFWLARLGPQPELLRRALEELSRHEAQVPSGADSLKAHYLGLRHRLAHPSYWLWNLLPPSSPLGHLEADLVAVAAQAPWEQARQTRLLNAYFAGRLRLAETPYWETAVVGQPQEGSSKVPHPVAGWLSPAEGAQAAPNTQRLSGLLHESWLGVFLQGWQSTRETDIQSLCRLRAARLCVALALYQTQEGRPAPGLEALVPRYLPELPVDPYSGQPFHYRVSQGEPFPLLEPGAAPGEPIRTVPPGQGILWSAGPDLRHGGSTSSERDVIYLVPQWPKAASRK